MAKDKPTPPPQQNSGLPPEQIPKPQKEQAAEKKPKTPKVAAPKIDPDLLTDEKVDDLIEYLKNLKITPEMRLKQTLASGLLQSLRGDGYDDERLSNGMAQRLASLENAPGIAELLKKVEAMIQPKRGTRKEGTAEPTDSENTPE